MADNAAKESQKDSDMRKYLEIQREHSNILRKRDSNVDNATRQRMQQHRESNVDLTSYRDAFDALTSPLARTLLGKRESNVDRVNNFTPLSTPLTSPRISKVGFSPAPSYRQGGRKFSTASSKVGYSPAPSCKLGHSTTSGVYHKAFDFLDDDAKCDVTGFTGREKKLLWASLDQMSRNEFSGELFAAKFVVWMYGNIPNMAANFEFGDTIYDDDSDTDASALKHARRIYESLYVFVKLLPFPDQMLLKVTEMARKHLILEDKPKVGSEYFEAMYLNFNSFIYVHLDMASECELANLWVALMKFIYTVVQKEEAKLFPTSVSTPMASVAGGGGDLEEGGEGKKEEESGKKSRRKCCSCCFPLFKRKRKDRAE